ncbi:uncharacterized protein LOC122025706 [Zingiber officinale]|uniref:uncharacterized protein LOC122025706 n=1 Tax=Zingiber officinale TaxID=94328 RepID=UPI001C4C4E9B|nr:uncharacterized protein LOC122025706 [Zingiber officinale]
MRVRGKKSSWQSKITETMRVQLSLAPVNLIKSVLIIKAAPMSISLLASGCFSSMFGDVANKGRIPPQVDFQAGSWWSIDSDAPCLLVFADTDKAVSTHLISSYNSGGMTA